MGYWQNQSRRLWPSGFAVFLTLIFTPVLRGQNITEFLRRATPLYGVTDSTRGKAVVVLTFDPECPVCRDARDEIRRISHAYQDVDFYLILVHPNVRVNAAALDYVEGIRCKLIPDNDGIVKRLGAKVMPEAFVFDEHGEMVYSGAIDDYFYKLGRRRAKITHRYLEDALKALAQGRKPSVQRVEPIGCFIER